MISSNASPTINNALEQPTTPTTIGRSASNTNYSTYLSSSSSILKYGSSSRKSSANSEDNLFMSSSPVFENYKRNSVSSSGTSVSSNSDTTSVTRVSTKHTKPRRSIVGKNCAICSDPFQLSVGGTTDRIISLTCEHDCHYECYLVMMNKFDTSKLPTCTICNRQTKPINSHEFDQIVQTSLSEDLTDSFVLDCYNAAYDPSFTPPIFNLPNVSPNGETSFNTTQLSYGSELFSPQFEEFQASTPLTASTTVPPFGFGMMSPVSVESKPASAFNTAVTTPQPTKEPKALVSHDEQLLQEMAKPKVKLIPEYSKILINESTKRHELPCLLNVNMSEYDINNTSKTIEEIEVERENRLGISNWVILNYLKTLRNFDNFKIKENSDCLVMFDILNVEEAPEQWETYHCFLFEDMLLLVDDVKGAISGSIKYKEDLASISVVNMNTIILNLSTISLPELKIRSSSNIVIKKWKTYLTKQSLSQNQHQRKPQERENDIYDFVPLIQMSTNAWDVISDTKIIPEEVKHMYELLNNDMELPLPLLKKLIPGPEPLPVRLILAVSLINKSSLSNTEYMAQIMRIIKNALNNLNPAVDKLGIVYISKSTIRTGFLEVTKKTSSYIAGISDWESMARQLECLSTYDNDNPAEDIDNLEEAALYLEATERLLELWGDCKYYKPQDAAGADGSNYIKKLVLLNDSFHGNGANPKSYLDKLHEKTITRLLRKVVRRFKFSVHAYLINSKFDNHIIWFLDKLMAENYYTLGSNFSRLPSIESFDIVDLIQNHIRKITVPCLKIKVSSLKKENIKVSRCELANNDISLLETIYQGNNDDGASAISLSNDFNGLGIYGEDEVLGFSELNIDTPADAIDEFGNGEDIEIFINDICPGYTKSILTNANINFSRRFKQILKCNALNDSHCSQLSNDQHQQDSDDEIFYKCPLLQYSGSYQNSKISATDINVELGFSKSNNSNETLTEYYNNSSNTANSTFSASRQFVRDSVNSMIFPSSKHTSIVSSIAASEFELPFFPMPLTNTRDILYAKRQIQLTVIHNLIYAIKLHKAQEQQQQQSNNTALLSSETALFASGSEVSEISETGNNNNGAKFAKSLILELISSIFAIGKGCKPITTSIKDFHIEGDLYYDQTSNTKYIEYLSFILGTIAELYEFSAEDAFNSSYELICGLCFQ